MTRLECILRPERFEEALASLEDLGVFGLTVTEVRGCGRQLGQRERQRMGEYQLRLTPKIKVELVVPDDRAEELSRVLIEAARTGEIGDGKLFVFRVDDAVRIRTGERGEAAL